MITFLFIFALSFTVIYAAVESIHDCYVILNDKGKSKYSAKWHNWGWAQNFFAFLPLMVWVFLTSPQLFYPLCIACIFLFWQLHDSIIGYRLHKDIFYLGSSGFDEILDNIFWGGATLSTIRIAIVFFSIYEILLNRL